MSESAETYGDFVLACTPIVRREVYRLRALGVPLPIEDAMQDGYLFLLEEPAAARKVARLLLRRRLINRYVEGGNRRVKREAVDIDGLVGAAVPRSESHEDDVVTRVSIAELLSEWPEFNAALPAVAKTICPNGHDKDVYGVVVGNTKYRRCRVCQVAHRRRMRPWWSS